MPLACICEGHGEVEALPVLLDADDECPVGLASDLSNRASTVVPDVPVCIVLADREYEAWFLASAPELDGTGGFDAARWTGEDPDAPRDAKKRVAECLGRKYSEVLDQPSLTARMDLEAAYARSRSFRKLCTDWSGRLA